MNIGGDDMLHWTKFDEHSKFHCVDYINGRNHIAETREILTFDIEMPIDINFS